MAFAEDLVLAEERTTEADREMILEGERVHCIVVIHFKSYNFVTVKSFNVNIKHYPLQLGRSR